MPTYRPDEHWTPAFAGVTTHVQTLSQENRASE
jgi:hypothetical protein